jgi:hypothetical protein
MLLLEFNEQPNLVPEMKPGRIGENIKQAGRGALSTTSVQHELSKCSEASRALSFSELKRVLLSSQVEMK